MGLKARRERVHIGVDLGGTNLKIGAITQNGNVLFMTSYQVNGLNSSHVRGFIEEKIRETQERLVDEHGVSQRQLGVVGIAVPGPVINGRLLKSHAYPGLETHDLHELGTLVNDASAALEGELEFGNGRALSDEEKKNSMIVTMGTRVGGRIRVGGKELKPANRDLLEFFWAEYNAPVISSRQTRPFVDLQKFHSARRNGGFEQLHGIASTQGIMAIAEKYAAANPNSRLATLKTNGGLTIQTIDRSAQEGDRAARSILRTAGAAVGFAAANRIRESGVKAVFFSGGLFRSKHMSQAFLEAIKNSLGKKKYASLKIWQTTVIEPGVLGAVAHALHDKRNRR